MRLLRLPALCLAAGLLLAGHALSGCADPPAENAVAYVENVAITSEALSDAYATFAMQAGLPDDDPRMRDEVLGSLINRQLVIQAAWDAGVRQSAEYREELARVRKRAAIDHYTARRLIDTLRVREADLRRVFVQSNTTYEARHLYAPSREAADALRARLMAGGTFEALAREVFADPTLAANGGYVGEFGHDEMDPAFEYTAFTLPIGAISEPVQTALGYSIIKVESRATVPLLTETQFAEKRASLERYERKRRRVEARYDHSRAVHEALDIRVAPAPLDELAALAAGEPGAMLVDTPASPDAWQTVPLVTFTSPTTGAQTWTVADVERLAAQASERQLAAVRDARTLKTFIEGLVVREELAARATEAGLDQGARYEAVVEERMGDWVFAQTERRMRETATPPVDSLRAYYAAHADYFTMPERVPVEEILVASKREAEELRARIEAGDDFATLARDYSQRPGAALAAGDLGLLSRGDLGVLGAPVFDAAPGALVGPLEVAGRYVLLRRGALQPPRPMTFAEARPQIAERLDVEFAQRWLGRYLDDLRRRYDVRIHDDAVARVRLFS
ncbi:MAG: peptidyl-prolyl cis-trans isomerase [Bacteroidota bacterium]